MYLIVVVPPRPSGPDKAHELEISSFSGRKGTSGHEADVNVVFTSTVVQSEVSR